jgi:polyisoprenoid-binding protein YceI
MRSWTAAVVSLAMMVVAAASASAVAADPTSWDVDTIHSGIYFEVRHLGIINVQGMFTKPTGTVTIDDQDISKSSVNATVEVGSILTGADPRDKHLQSADFFDVAKFPAMAFQSTKIWKTADGGVKMTGNLTIHGVTKEVTFDVTGPSAPINALKATRRGVAATTKINRKDFGITFDDTVGDDVVINLQIDLVKK